MMNASDLRDSILKYALEGKLGTSDKNDEPILKTLKNNGLDIRLSGNTDIPYDLPEGWSWTKIEDITEKCDNPLADGPFGSNLKREHYTDNHEVRIIQLSNIGENGWKDSNVKYTSFEHLKTIERSKVDPGDIVIAKMMPAGRAIEVPNNDKAYVLSSDAVKFKPFHLLNKSFLLYAINSPVFRIQVYAEVHGVTRVRTSLGKLKKYLVPLPPLAEQKRIVAKIEELMPYVNQYAEASTRLTALNTAFSEQMKKSILQEAVQGRLVPQDSSDEPARLLLIRDQENKKKEGRKKDIKQKNVSQIIREEDGNVYEVYSNKRINLTDALPFEIPSNWEWIHLGYVCDIARGGSPRPIKSFLTDASDGINWIKIGDSDIGGKYISSTKEKIKPEGLKKSRFVHKGDFLLTNSMSFGRPYILKCDGCIHDGWLVISGYENVYDRDFLFDLLSSPYAFYQFCDVVSGAVVKNLNSDKVAKAVFPVPPMKEQKRIVKKIEELMPYCDELKKKQENV